MVTVKDRASSRTIPNLPGLSSHSTIQHHFHHSTLICTFQRLNTVSLIVCLFGELHKESLYTTWNRTLTYCSLSEIEWATFLYMMIESQTITSKLSTAKRNINSLEAHHPFWKSTKESPISNGVPKPLDQEEISLCLFTLTVLQYSGPYRH